MKWSAAFLAAVRFLTCIPTPGSTVDSARFREDMARGLYFFPLVGAAIGAAAAIVLVLADLVLPFFLAAIAALAVELRLTGALHEDGVADFCDAFGGGRTREETLRILKDSRIGSFGTVGLVAALALRAGGLIAVADPAKAAIVLAVSGAVGRALAVAVMALVPPAPGHDGLAKEAGASVRWASAACGLLLVSPLLAWGVAVHWKAMAAGLAVCVVFVVWFRALLLRRLGGVTGDCLGFAAYFGIVAMTVSFALDV
ncbi:MAG: adenosylcobinamide-GDP ribazoletransferase [Hyphomicrobiaceae bacterium]